MGLINNFGTLPKQIAHPAIPFDVENLYQPKLEYCIQTMATSPGITLESSFLFFITIISHPISMLDMGVKKRL